MGLDLCLDKIRRLSDGEFESLKKSALEAGPWNTETQQYGYVMNEYEAKMPENDHVRKFMRHFYVLEKYLNEQAVKSDYGIPTDYFFERYAENGGEYEVAFACDGKQITVSIQEDEIAEKYTIYRNREFYAYHSEEIGYWRKEYDLLRKIKEICGTVEDSTYIPCTEEMLDAIREYGGEYLEKGKIACSDGEELFFWVSY